MEAPTTLAPIACNQAVVIGELTQDPERRVLPSGTSLVTFSLTVRADGQKTTSVPLSWFDPPKKVDRWKAGDQLITVGSVVRRFYRSGGTTGSRTEVEVQHAESLASNQRSRRVADQAGTALGKICAALDAP